MGAGWWKYHPKNGSSDLSKKWLKPSTGACFQLFLSTAPRLAKNSVVKDVQRGEPWIAMSKAYTGLGRTQEADSALQRARDMEPGSGKMDRHAAN